MQLNPKDLDKSSLYKLLTGSIIPRPIAWISSINNDGINNLAPFSYFNIVGEKHIMFSTAKKRGENKDTLNNILETGEFVLNMVTAEVVEAMNATATELHPHEDEFIFANVTPIPSELIKPNRVKECKVAFECKLIHHYTIPSEENTGNTILIGEIVMMHFDESVLLDNYKINLETYNPVSRLAGSNYAKLGELFSIIRG